MYFQIMHSVLVETNIRYIAFGNIALTSVLGKQSSKTPSTKAKTGPSIIADIPIEVHALFKIRVYYKFRKSCCGVKITSYDRTFTTMGFAVSARLIYIESWPSLPFHCIVLNESGTTSTARQWWVSWQEDVWLPSSWILKHVEQYNIKVLERHFRLMQLYMYSV